MCSLPSVSPRNLGLDGKTFAVRPIFLASVAFCVGTIAACTPQEGGDSGRGRRDQVAPPVDGQSGARVNSAVGAGAINTGSTRDPLDAVPGDYSGSVTIGDPREEALIPKQFLISIDLGLSLRNIGAAWNGEVSLKRFVTTNPTDLSSPDCQTVAARELKASLETVSIQPDGAFQATSAPMRFCVRSNKAVERRLQLRGTLITRRDCAHVELRGSSYGDYQETLKGLITLPSGNETTLTGTFILTKVKEPPDAALPPEGVPCADLNP